MFQNIPNICKLFYYRSSCHYFIIFYNKLIRQSVQKCLRCTPKKCIRLMHSANAFMYPMEINPPLALLHLYHLERVVVKQLTSTSRKTPATYVVKSPEGKVIFKAEDKQVMSETKQKESPFDIRCYDSEWNEVMSFHRSVSTPDIVENLVCGQLTNVIHFRGENPEFLIKDVFGSSEPMLRVRTPEIKCIECDYHIFSNTVDQQEKVGVISKKCSGFLRELFTTCDKYEIHFPSPLDVNLKAALLCNCILIDYLYHN